MNNNFIQPPPSKQQGAAIIEAFVSILIFSVGVLGIVGMQANMLKNTSDTQFRSEAANIAKSTIGNMWLNPTTLASFIGTSSISDVLPGGTLSVSQPVAGGVMYLIEVKWQQPGEENEHRYTSTAYITP